MSALRVVLMALPKRLASQTWHLEESHTVTCLWEGCPERGLVQTIHGSADRWTQIHHQHMHGVKPWDCPECHSTTGQHREGCRR